MEPLTFALDGPNKNALSSGLMRRLREELREAGGRPILLTGTGGAFSAGVDLKEVLGFDAAGARAFLTLIEEMAGELFAYPGPTVAYVNGHAIAGGTVLALCCDFRVAADDPEILIGLNEVALGVPFPPAVLKLVGHRVPRRHLEEVVLGAALFPPTEACMLGLVDEVAADGAVAALRHLDGLARQPATAYAAAKQGLRAGVLAVSAEERRRFEEEDLPIWTSEPLRERIRAYLAW